MNLGLDGKVVLITGGSSGIGRAIAAAFRAEGARVAICGRHAGRLAATAQALRGTAVDGVLDVVADVGEPADVARLVEATVARFGGLDVVVSNAGTHLRGTLEEIGVNQVVCFSGSPTVHAHGEAWVQRAVGSWNTACTARR